MAEDKIKCSKAIRDFPEYEYLLQGFRKHIRGQTPDFFGCDFPYDHANTPRVVRDYLSHIHIGSPLDNYPRCWITKPPRKRKNLFGKAENDFALVYWHDLNNNAYYLLAIIGPDAHDYSVWMPRLKVLAEQCRDIDLRG